ncbi:hypothetical protein [Paraburkholderia sp.]|nr:hypothetical protein [Paraburkholderia sp.]
MRKNPPLRRYDLREMFSKARKAVDKLEKLLAVHVKPTYEQ